MKKYINCLAVVSCFVLSAASAHADGEKCDSPTHSQSNSPQQGSMFNNADTNGDGSISKSEFDDYYAKHNARHFKALDTNKDGMLTPDEMHDGRKQEMGRSPGLKHLDKRFNAADANHDGGLDKREAKAMPMLEAYFDKVDANKDGKVTRQEYLDAMPLLHRAKDIDASGKGQML
ncbi:MAG: EF-hand domain-containing protein [Gallionella sp.]|nr:EF-hand domain-containing protein [Gallionella sp.]